MSETTTDQAVDPTAKGPSNQERFDAAIAAIEQIEFTPEEVLGMHARIARLGQAFQTFAYQHMGAFATTVVLYEAPSLVPSYDGDQRKALEESLKQVDPKQAAIIEFVAIPRIETGVPGRLAQLTRQCGQAINDYAERNLNEPAPAV